MAHDDFDDEPYVVIEKHGGSVGSFLAGIALGAGLALLLAPRSGAETRDDIARRARGARDRARDLADDVTGEVTDRVDRARAAVESRVDRARTAVDMRRQQVQRAVEAGRTAAQQAREDLERRIAETKAAYQAGARVAHERPTGGLAGAAGGMTGGAAGALPDLAEDDLDAV